MKMAIREQRSEMTNLIKEKCYEIEENMSLNFSPSKNIDLNIIEELKKKRA
jgi:hypothetical protein